jgi:hypothetical protein
MSLPRKKIEFFIPFLFFAFSHNILYSQNKLVQLSGIISDETTKYPVAYAVVILPGTPWGTNASREGFFSIVVSRADTVKFTALGYKPKYYIVPDTGLDNIESIAVFLNQDTLTLDPVEIYPWPNPEDFREAFLAYQENQQYIVGDIPGIKSRDEIDTIPRAPSPILNPISFLYEEIVKPIEWNRRKRHMPEKLPEWK